MDAGLSRRETFRRLESIGESPEALDAILISHEHADHIAGVVSLAGVRRDHSERRAHKQRKKIPVYLSALTRQAIPPESDVELTLEVFRPGQKFAIQDLEVEPFTIPHDAVDPVAFCFSVNGIRVGVCTDLGYMPDSVKVHLRACHCLVLESNHDLDMLKVGPYPWAVKQRVMSRTGHLSNHAVSEFLLQDYDGQAQVLVLAHLSEENNHPEIARLSAAMALESRRGRRSDRTRLVVSSQRSPTELFRF